MWINAAKWQPEKSKLTTWLHRITHNLCIDYLRKHGNTLTSDKLDAESTEQPLQSQQSNSLDDDEKQRLDDAIRLLPEAQRSALMLCHYAGFSNKEAAAIMNVSVKALESSISRARRSLRSKLESQGMNNSVTESGSGEINSEEKTETIG